MSAETVAVLRAAVADPARVASYHARVAYGSEHECWPWYGAIVSQGSGRMYIGDHYAGTDRRRQTFSIIAYRFGFALLYGVDLLLTVPTFSHRCDNPLCQNVLSPEHCQPSTPRENRREYLARREALRGALADVRGARGRAHAIRAALRDGADLGAAIAAGIRAEQHALFPEPPRALHRPTPGQRDWPELLQPQPESADVSEQPRLFDPGEQC